MPAMIVALIAMPFGLDEWPLRVMGWGIDAMMTVARWVASLPGSLVFVPGFPFAALFVIICGGLWLIVWRRPWRLFGLVVIGAGIALTSIHDRVDIFIDRDAKVVAPRGKDGKLQAPKSRRAFYAIAQWLKAGGDERQPKEASVGAGWQCDAYSCVTLVKGKLVSFIAKPDAIREDCERVAILIAPMDILQPCPAPKIILDRGALWERGSATISIWRGVMLSLAPRMGAACGLGRRRAAGERSSRLSGWSQKRKRAVRARKSESAIMPIVRRSYERIRSIYCIWVCLERNAVLAAFWSSGLLATADRFNRWGTKRPRSYLK